jgi:hypothetical protein
MMQLRLFGSLSSLILCGLSLIAQTSDANTQKPSEPRKSAHQLYVEDQEDTRTIKDAVTDNEYHQHVKVREASLRTSLAAGEVKTGDDFVEAAYIFQHGDSPADFLFAHILAMEGMARGIVSAKWIAAATLDRYLQSIKQPQVFGTNYILDPTHPVHAAGAPFPFGRTLEPYNDSFLPDSVRTDFCVPTLAQQKQNIAMFNAGKWPRETMHPPCH